MHAVMLINSVSHMFGRRRFGTSDQSRNNMWLAFFTLGEGWHNNHHRYMASARQGFYWWEVDVTYYGLKALERFGLVWSLRQPPREVLQEGRAYPSN
jgi:stearoyl-CoA desaturase (Delta-9 desaturase)